ncbi:MAG: AAA family ATPase [Campylobacterales bacterium]
MKLTSLTVNNLFSYCGEHRLEFDGVTCIIGKNGFGKTSILNSIKLCLGQNDIDIGSILNNNATEKKCSVSLDFEEFVVSREWVFEPKIEEALAVIFNDDHTVENAEAEHFIQNRIPPFLIDFLFYDGEVGNNLFLLSKTKLRSLFDYVFDLDLLGNTQRDTLAVSKKLLEENKSGEAAEFAEMESKRISLTQTIDKQNELLDEKTRAQKTLETEIQKLDTQIRNQNKRTKKLHEERSEKKALLDQLSRQFKEVVLWQMPLLLNPTLFQKLKAQNRSPLVLQDEKMFLGKFRQFLEQTGSSLPANEALALFKGLMLTDSSPIEPTMEPDAFRGVLTEMKDLQFDIDRLSAEIVALESSATKNEVVNKLAQSRDSQHAALMSLRNEIAELEESIEHHTQKAKEIAREVAQRFKDNQKHYASLRGYEELSQIAIVCERVYKELLEEKLEAFNARLRENTEPFLSQYKHIKEIFVSDRLAIVITDGERPLDTNLLSAGQKQVLNFLIIKTILDFKAFVSFVMVDTPFGRLSNENKKLLLNECYLRFESLILLLTDSEYEFVMQQKVIHSAYHITRNAIGSAIERNI